MEIEDRHRIGHLTPPTYSRESDLAQLMNSRWGARFFKPSNIPVLAVRPSTGFLQREQRKETAGKKYRRINVNLLFDEVR